jgi:hypothetical protein
MDKHSSILVTQIAVGVLLLSVAVPVARFLCGFFLLSRPLGLLFATALVFGALGVFMWICDRRNRG